MNETILTTRQEAILAIINQSKGIVRENIQQKIQHIYPISKPTLLRDLNTLVKFNFIKTEGKARNTLYFPFSESPLNRKFNLDSYFKLEVDERISSKTSFDFEVFDYLKEELLSKDEIQRLNSAGGNLSEKTKDLPVDLIKKELERFTIELAWKSSRIEGNTYTLLETESLIKDQKKAPTRTNHETQMILNHKETFETLLKNPEYFTSLSIGKINQIHNTLIKGLDISSGIREREVGITGTTYKPLGNIHQLTEAMEKTVEIINQRENPYEKAFIASVMIPYIQPYNDGNKRTGRMLCNALLLANDLLPLSYRSVDEDTFKKCLIIFYEQLSLVAIKEVFIDQVLFSNKTYFV